jgi:hypothetical protein
MELSGRRICSLPSIMSSSRMIEFWVLSKGDSKRFHSLLPLLGEPKRDGDPYLLGDPNRTGESSLVCEPSAPQFAGFLAGEAGGIGIGGYCCC